MDWSTEGWRSAFRIELRVHAIGFASRGWPVVPGTYPVGPHWAGHKGHEQAGPVPVHDDWQDRPGVHADEVASWWSTAPYSLLVATGSAVEAIEVPATMGHHAASVLRTVGVPVPIVATPDRRWYFLTSSGHRPYPELADDPDVTFHGTGSWVPMPPTTFQHGLAHWRVKPEVCGWRLPSPELVQDTLRTVRYDSPDVANLVPTAG
jgi:hypothetical protein